MRDQDAAHRDTDGVGVGTDSELDAHPGDPPDVFDFGPRDTRHREQFVA